jgi:hypothetical protein
MVPASPSLARCAIKATGRVGRERLLRDCDRPRFALARLRKRDREPPLC